MMELQVGEGKSDKVLISKYKGNIYAIGAFCSHFGAPLVNGVMFDDKVLCPWHAAGFSVVSGAIERRHGTAQVAAGEVGFIRQVKPRREDTYKEENEQQALQEL
jgi:nitrite reductase/ring-hydroxylating ferredoxin subunit